MFVMVITGTRHDREFSPKLLREELEHWRAPTHTRQQQHFFVGDCRTGVDRFAYETLTYWTSPKVERVLADWDKFGNGAGPKRNQDMLDKAIAKAGHAQDVCVLAYPGLDPKGTRDCVRQAIELGCWVRVIGPNAKRLFPRGGA